MVVKRAIRGLVAVAVALGCAAPVAHASLGVPGGDTSTPFMGSGSPGTATALASFEAAIGGRDNGTTAGEQANGFRHVNWDAIRVDGTDPGSTVIKSSHVIAPAPNRLEPWGLGLGPEIAVANDGFASVNPNANFTPFSAPNVWGPYNSMTPTAEFDIVAPADAGTTTMPAQTRGLGIVFLGSTGSTQIQYFNGDIPLGSVTAPAGTTSFAGLLFPAPVVTRVVVELGGAEIFAFDGSTPTPGGSNPVAGDDIALAEPAPARGTVAATAGIPVTAALDTFTESNPSATPKALIDWGDGTRTAGTITSGASGTFVVTGNHAYAHTGSYLADVTVDDSSGPEQTKETEIGVGPRATTTAVTCSPGSVAVSASTTCTATVSDAAGAGASAPAGVVSFASPTPAAAFPESGACLLGPTAATGVSSCAVQFSPGQLPPSQARIVAAYTGDADHTPSNATGAIGVHAQRCTIKALTRRLRAQGMGVLVTCDARANVQIVVQARVARKGHFRPFQLRFGTLRGSVTAARPTVLVVKPTAGVLPTLRAALHHRQRISLKLTLTATSHSTTRTTTTRASALRLS
ncbi:MAG: hypothetical protein ACTHMY_03730 [Solirubrobacteraceae bacterium]